MSSENQQVLRLQLAYLMHRFLLIALGMGFLLPTAVAHPLPHGEGGPLEAINHSVVSEESVAEEHGPSEPDCTTCPECCFPM